MKIFHTGDWHIGKIVHQMYMTEDQRYILEQFVEHIKVEKPDVVVIAGDLYDRAVPPVEAVELLDEVFSRILLELNTPVIAISGNHDSPDRLGFASGILKNKGLYIEGRLKREIKPVTIHDDKGPVNFYLVPYADPAVVKVVYEREDIHNHNDAMKVIIEGIRENTNKDERNVLVAHGFVIGDGEVVKSDSERPLSIGGTEFIDLCHFEGFHYTALGHLHGPQKVGSDRVRYSGSLMKYSFSEVRQNKTFTVVDMDEKGEIAVELKQLVPMRDMREIKGYLKDLLDEKVYKGTNLEDYLNVILLDEGELIDPINKLRAVYPNVLRLTREEVGSVEGMGGIAQLEEYSKKSMLELFKDFYSDIIGKEFSNEKEEVLVKVLKETERLEAAM